MISPYMAIQNAMMAQNATTAKMMGASDAMLSTVAFGNSQPLRPSFGSTVAASDTFELQNKADETRYTALEKLMVSLEKGIAKSIKRSTPKFGGLDYKA
ncbi:hypothetical protein IJ182_03085 [bacterium]|nr:hypothetical protein [bacterium]